MTREEAIKNIKEHCYFANLIPPAKEALDMAIKALEQEPCEDCIRRSDIGLTDFEIIMCNGDYREGLKILLEKIAAASSVTPQTKMGRWINAKVGKMFPSNDYKCSECGNILDFDGVNCGRGDANYCPNCGAKMEAIRNDI